MKKILMVSGLLALFSVTALLVSAAGAGYAISTTGIATSSNTISLSGSASADPYKGNDTQQHVIVRDWGDGSSEEEATSSLTFGSGKTFTGTWEASHAYASSGNYTIIIEVCHLNCNGNDEGSDFSSVTMTSSVGTGEGGGEEPVNTPPVASPQSVSTDEDQSVAITLSGNDADSEPLSYSTTTNPSNGTLSGTGQNLTYTPDADWDGSDSFSFKVNDGTDDSATAVVSITVAPVNDAPILAPIGNKNADELSNLSFQLSATDVDSAILTYSLTTPLLGASVTSEGLFSWTPTEAQGPGAYFLTVEVSDGTLTDTETFEVTVAELPDATLESIAITEPATKLIYYIGDTFDFSGLVVTGTYSDASTSTLLITESNISGFDSSAPASGQVITITYGGKTTTYTVDITTMPIIIPVCDNSNSGGFDGFATGSVNGQFGWHVSGDFDQEVVPNTYGYSTFGCQSLRLSDATTSVFVLDQTFSNTSADEAGETDALSGDAPIGTRQNRFEAQFDLASTMQDEQPGMHMSVSPDRGDGTRMSSLGFDETVSGIDVYFHDFTGTTSPATFTETQIATGLSRSTPHTFKFLIDFVDGPSNDVVKIFIDGALAHTGTSWENFYRYDETAWPDPVSTSSRTVNSLVFYERGTANLTDKGNGYLIDNVLLSATSTTATSTATTTPPDTTSTSTPPVATSTPPVATTTPPTSTTTPPVILSSGGAGGPNGVPGCMDPTATNYDPTAIYAGTCTYTSTGEVLGAATTTIFGVGGGSSLGEVLGASSSSLPLSCSEYLTLQKGITKKALRQNAKNSPALVMLLQRFLNEYVAGSNLPVTGFFGPLTTSAVKKLQIANMNAILAPWKLTKPTGIAYVTTVAYINNIKCPTLNIIVTKEELVPAID